MNNLQENINTLLDDKIRDIKQGSNSFATGTVKSVREYVVEATGLYGVSYFEKVKIGQENEGYVDAINQDSVMIALTRTNNKIKVGDQVVSTNKEFTAKFSPNSFGRIINIFGEDCLSGKIIDDLLELPIESDPISIMDRTSVNRPLYTGIAGIDLLYPIGRGQRQLIIGDKKTGKTQICLDTIVRQKNENVICIYVAIGKTKKEVKEIYSQLLKRGSMQYTIIVAAFNDDCAPVLRNTPYAAISIANYMLKQGKDILVMIDDLKRHADVCREIALLMDKTPGRDAYPPDIFYTHSRMLEMGCQHKNGGSITILPICETKGGDITDFISTNIISITDGQIVLSEKNFEKGQKPAIDYGLSVSRLGGAVQTAEMKKAGPPIRRELLNYLEQKEIFELANVDEMSESLRNSMKRGSAILNCLKQNKYAVKEPQEILNQFKEI